VETIRAAFPDWDNRIDEILATDGRVVTRMTWSGTHQGRLRNIEPTGARVQYSGAAFFRLSDGLIQEAWIVGDTQELWRALGCHARLERAADYGLKRVALIRASAATGRTLHGC
jgi:predicted ester cyclase